MKSIHITVGSKTAFADYLRAPINSGTPTEWPVPKQAKPGDDVLFLIPAQHGSLCAIGTVLNVPVKSEDWVGKYTTEIGNLMELTKPISIESLTKQFPNWGYPTYARGYTTVPPEAVETLQKMVVEAK